MEKPFDLLKPQSWEPSGYLTPGECVNSLKTIKSNNTPSRHR